MKPEQTFNRLLTPLAQRTLVEVMRAFERHAAPDMEPGAELEPPVNFAQLLFEHNFPGWFVRHAQSSFYRFNWQRIVMDLREGRFFFPHGWYDGASNITGQYLSKHGGVSEGERLNRRLAALAATLPSGEQVRRSLELEGFSVNEKTLELVPTESIVNEQQEEERINRLVNQSALPRADLILKHIGDARDLFVQGKDHPSIGESRSFVQAIIDDIGTETNRRGGHSRGFPGGTKERLQYLEDVGFFTSDDKAAFQSAWGFLSAGTHPGIPPHELARIGLILALEFGQLLLLKFANWSGNDYKRFA